MNIEEAIKARHSVRAYKQQPLTDDTVKVLENAIEEQNRKGHLHIQLIKNEPKAFQGKLAKYGKPVSGGKAWILPPPGKEELIAAVRRHCDAIRKYASQTSDSLYSCGWLLDIARCIYTLRYGDVISKTQAGIWALKEHLFPDEEALKKTIEIRQSPLTFKDREDIRLWLKKLGPVVQNYADVLAHELQIE